MKKTIALGIILLITLISLAGCDNKNDEANSSGYVLEQEFSMEAAQPADDDNTMPGDFNFSLNYGIGGINKIDTYEGLLTKDLIVNGTETINFIIPPDKMREIFTVFMEHKISALPKDINADTSLGDVTMRQTPADRYTLSYTLDGETKTIACDDGGPWNADGPPETRDRLVAFADFIREYINGTEEYKNMQPAEGGYA